ncbi:MAG: efflux RND transporter periplasmic adaptor subunit [Thermodesulfobacteriota bacterium]
MALLPLLFFILFAMCAGPAAAQQGPPKVPVKAAKVTQRLISEQISLVGTAEAIATSTVAAEVSGIVEYFPVKEGDAVKRGDLLVRLKDTDLRLRLKAAQAARTVIQADLENTQKELQRISKLRETKSISETRYDTAYYANLILEKRLLQSDVEIEQIEYEISRKKVVAPFSGVVAKEHTQVGEWINPGGAIVALLDLEEVRITVDVPERYVVNLQPDSRVSVVIKSISPDPMAGRIYAILPRGDAAARTIPVRVSMRNPGAKIRSGMEALVTFTLATKKQALLVPKDAVVMAGSDRLVFKVMGGQAAPVMITILGYDNSEVAVTGDLNPDEWVVTRGNERLRPGQAVEILP